MEIFHAQGLTLRVKNLWRFSLADREAEGREDGGEGGESDVYNDAPFVFILVSHFYCEI